MLHVSQQSTIAAFIAHVTAENDVVLLFTVSIFCGWLEFEHGRKLRATLLEGNERAGVDIGMDCRA